MGPLSTLPFKEQKRSLCSSLQTSIPLRNFLRPEKLERPSTPRSPQRVRSALFISLLLVNATIEGGINFFDTADVYSAGFSEKTIVLSFRNLNISRKDVVPATKVYGRMGPGRNDVGASRKHIMDGIEASLRRLQTDYVDLYQIHANDSVTPMEETLRALDTLVTQGKVRYIGVSNWQAWKIARSVGISEAKNLARFESLQAYYSIAGRDLERELAPLLEAEKIGLLV